jgi:hypothetical protein
LHKKVYIADLDKMKAPGTIQGQGLIRVNYPQPYTDINQWKEKTKKDFADFKTPASLPNGFTFKRGELKYIMEISDMANQDKYYEMLKKKAAAAKANMAWQKAESEDTHSNEFIFDIPSLLYTHDNKEQIEIKYLVTPKSIKTTFRKVGPVEKVKVAGFDGEYTVNKHDFLSETGTMQDIQWKEVINEASIQYTVSSPSLTVTKDDLLLVANHLK